MLKLDLLYFFKKCFLSRDPDFRCFFTNLASKEKFLDNLELHYCLIYFLIEIFYFAEF